MRGGGRILLWRESRSVLCGGRAGFGAHLRWRRPLKPVTLATQATASGSGVVALAQDGRRVAWLLAATGECELLNPVKPVHLLDVVAGIRTALPSSEPDCSLGGPPSHGLLALAGDRALWMTERPSQQEDDGYFGTAAPDTRLYGALAALPSSEGRKNLTGGQRPRPAKGGYWHSR